MTWIFEDCPDQFGSCVRQDILFGLSVLVLFLASYSCYRVRRQDHRLVYELLPLSINALTSLYLVGIYTQTEVFNIRISLLIIELYSYFILIYSFIHLVVQRTAHSPSTSSNIRRLFVLVSTICLLALIAVSVLTILGLVSCDEDQGVGSIILVVLELPLLLVTYIYSNKSKTILKQNSSAEYSQTESNQHLLSQEQEFRRVKLLQLKFIRIGFVTTFVLHVGEITLFYVGNNRSEFGCSSQSNEIQVSSALAFTAMFIENVTQLLPHFIIPIIFWYLPSRITKQAASMHLSNVDFRQESQNNRPKLKIKRQESKLVNDVQNQQQIRKKLGGNIPKRLERTSTI